MVLDALESLAGELVAFDLVFKLGGRDLLAHTIGNIAQMAEGGGIVAVEDRGHDIFLLAAADGLDEVSLMILLAVLGELLDLLVVVVVGPAAVFAGEVVTIFTLDVDADADEALVGIHDGAVFLTGQTANFEDERRGFVVVDGDFGIGSGRVIVIAEAAAEG